MNTLNLLVAFGIRLDAEEGQKPDVIAAATEEQNEANPDYMGERMTEANMSDEYSTVALVEVNLNLEQIMAIIDPPNIVAGKVAQAKR